MVKGSDLDRLGVEFDGERVDPMVKGSNPMVKGSNPTVKGSSPMVKGSDLKVEWGEPYREGVGFDG